MSVVIDATVSNFLVISILHRFLHATAQLYTRFVYFSPRAQSYLEKYTFFCSLFYDLFDWLPRSRHGFMHDPTIGCAPIDNTSQRSYYRNANSWEYYDNDKWPEWLEWCNENNAAWYKDIYIYFIKIIFSRAEELFISMLFGGFYFLHNYNLIW